MKTCKRKNTLTALIAAAILFAASGPCLGADILVFDFRHDGQAANAWMSIALTDYAIRIINTQAPGRAMPREQLLGILSRWPGGKRNNISFETEDAIGQRLGAKVIIDASLSETRTGLQFTGTIINPDTGAVDDISFQTTDFGISTAQTILFKRLKEKLGSKAKSKTNALQGTSDSEAYKLFWRAAVLYEKGSPDKADPLLERARERDPGYAEPAILSGRILLDKSFFSKAADTFRRAADKWPSDARPQFFLGLTLYLQRQTQPAKAAFEKAIRLDSDNPEYYYNLGILEKDIFLYTEAFRELEKTVSLDPTIYDAWYQLAVLYAYTKQESNALDCLEKAVEWGGREIASKAGKDADLNWLRINPRFRKIIAK